MTGEREQLGGQGIRAVGVEFDDGLAIVSLDDGGRNLLSLGVLEDLRSALDHVTGARAIILRGRPGYFTAGLDLKYLERANPADIRLLVKSLAKTVFRIWLEPSPVVGAITGHCIAGGTMLSMACDYSVAAEGDYRWGMIESRIGLVVPEFAIAIAREVVARDHLSSLLLEGLILDPVEAASVGYANCTARGDDVMRVVKERASDLGSLNGDAYAGTKRRLRSKAARAAMDGLDVDLAELFPDD